MRWRPRRSDLRGTEQFAPGAVTRGSAPAVSPCRPSARRPCRRLAPPRRAPSRPARSTDSARSVGGAPPLDWPRRCGRSQQQLAQKLNVDNLAAEIRSPAASASVLEDYDATLNQTNIANNNNKYYIIQARRRPAAPATHPSRCSRAAASSTRGTAGVGISATVHVHSSLSSGRVGEPGQSALSGPSSRDEAIASFEKKFKDKTANDWAKRACRGAWNAGTHVTQAASSRPRPASTPLSSSRSITRQPARPLLRARRRRSPSRSLRRRRPHCTPRCGRWSS